MQPLREEVEEVVKSEGWTKAGLDQIQAQARVLYRQTPSIDTLDTDRTVTGLSLCGDWHRHTP